MSKIPQTELYHHGIKGQHWGKRNGPPYPLGSDVSTGKKLKNTSNNKSDGSINTKYLKRAAIAIGVAAGVTLATYGGYKAYKVLGPKLLDKTLTNKKVQTLSLNNAYDFKKYSQAYASFEKIDNLNYSDNIGYKLLNKAKENKAFGDKSEANIYKLVSNAKNMKIASERSAKQTFSELYKNDKDFNEYTNNIVKLTKNGLFANGKVYSKAENGDISSLYKVFNKYAPLMTSAEGINDAGKSTAFSMNNKFYSALKNKGYSALYDMNDAGKLTNSPIVIFDSNSISGTRSTAINSNDLWKDYKKLKNINNIKMASIPATFSGSAIITNALLKNDDNKKSKNDN